MQRPEGISLIDEENYATKLKVYDDKQRSNISIFASNKNYDYRYYLRFHKYIENPGHPSDVYVYSFTPFVEGILSISVGGYFTYIGIAFIVVILMNILWSLLFTIKGADAFFNQNNFTSLFEVPVFVASLLYVEIWSFYRDVSVRPLKIYLETIEWIKKINDSFHYAFLYEMMSVKNFAKNNINSMSTETLAAWYKQFSDTVKTLTDYEFALAVYTLRVHVPYDYDFEYLKTPSLSKEKLEKLYNEANKRKINEKMLTPEFIISFVTRKIKEIIFLMPVQRTSEKLPKLSLAVQNEVMASLTGLERNIIDSAVNKSIPEQSLYTWTRNGFMLFWIMVIIPFIAWNSVQGFLPLFGTIIQMMLLFPLINAWYVGKPFVHSSHYSGPNYFKWRRDVYKILEIDKKEREEKLKEIRDWMNQLIIEFNRRSIQAA
jgi:hypothetical protein